MSSLGLDLGDVAKTLLGEDKSDSDIVQGTVVSQQASNSYTVTIQGDSTNIVSIKTLTPVLPGDTVWLLKKGTFLLILARNNVPQWPNIMEYSTNVPDSVTGAITDDWAGISFNFRKFYDSTQLLVSVTFTGRTSAETAFQIGFRIGSTDYMWSEVINPVNWHLCYTGYLRTADHLAGLHNIKMRVGQAGSGVTISSDANDRNGIIVQEIPVPRET